MSTASQFAAFPDISDGSSRFRGLRVALLVAIAVSAGACDQARPRRETSSPRPRAAAAAGVVPARYGLRPAERRAVEDFLRRHPDLRLPAEDDRRVSTSGEGDLRHLYGVYNPYFVRGDLNDDGILDFVMAFVRRDSTPGTPWFTVAVFPGRDDSGRGESFGPEILLERDVTLAAGDLSIDRDAVVITPDLDDEATRRYRWDPARRAYVFVRDDESDSEPPSVSRT